MYGLSPAEQPLPATSRRQPVEDWEDWEDDRNASSVDDAEPHVVQPLPPPVYTRDRTSTKPSTSRASRHPSSKLKRLRSRRRQKAQNAKAGIKLVTDMAVFKRGNHVAHQARPQDSRPAKFVDAAALRALEGEPSSASVGNWNWLNKEATYCPHGPSSAQAVPTPAQELSPEDRPIVIGISLSPSHMSSPEATPQQAPLRTSEAQHPAQPAAVADQDPEAAGQSSRDIKTNAQTSVWSPDTPNTLSPFNHFRPASSVYSRAVSPAVLGADRLPPVPALPASYQKTHGQQLASAELEGSTPSEDDGGTPCKLFEEDGNSPATLPTPSKGLFCTSPDSAVSKSHGLWDHVVTPFLDKKPSFSSRKMRTDSPGSEPNSPRSFCIATEGGRPITRHILPFRAPIVRKPTPRTAPSPIPSSQVAETCLDAPTQPTPEGTADTWPAKDGVAAAAENGPKDQPPPYSPPKKAPAAPVQYRAVFPPQHPLHTRFPPSPCPVSPGLAATMTSQGATAMTDIPLTPAADSRARPPMRIPLPVRPPSSYDAEEPRVAATSPARRVERQRRRHEKEVVARRLGGFWRGRGCVPTTGCFGRTGREGRRRRRVWLMVWLGIISLMVLVVVLAVVLTRRHHEPPGEPHSIWVNLTDFPPMPTGVLTVIGPDNSASRSACTAQSTLWSCSLPKDQHDMVTPYQANQPTIVMQVQWDNSSQTPGRPVHLSTLRRRGAGGDSRNHGALGRRQAKRDFIPRPAAPHHDEIWFLGNTTDDVQSENKAGEPTPFYISLLKSAHEPVQGSVLSRREDGTRIGNASLEKLLPTPDLEADGTPAPATMLPNPVQQPVWLFDRGLPTEHFGFYTHFRRSLFLKSVTILNQTDAGNITLDEGGGCRKNEANHVVTWGETRVLIRIWTRTLGLNTSALLRPDASRGIGGTGDLIRPETMPWPVTVTLDTHGGDPDKKLVWSWPLDKRQRVGTGKAELLANNMGVGGTWINPRGTGNAKIGGFDGGSGGCRCEWVNWVKQVS